LNRISDKKALYLVAYQLNVQNAVALSELLAEIVPGVLKKLVLIDNSLKDSSVSGIFDKLADNQGGGLRCITVV